MVLAAAAADALLALSKSLLALFWRFWASFRALSFDWFGMGEGTGGCTWKASPHLISSDSSLRDQQNTLAPSHLEQNQEGLAGGGGGSVQGSLGGLLLLQCPGSRFVSRVLHHQHLLECGLQTGAQQAAWFDVCGCACSRVNTTALHTP